MSGSVSALLPDGRRLHLQHGPIDLIIQAFGAPAEIKQAYRQAISRFDTVLDELVSELDGLRQPISSTSALSSTVAKRMIAATKPISGVFITPMAAVAGAVADEVLQAIIEGRTLDRAYVNNGGDIAIHLASGAVFDVGMALEVQPMGLAGRLTISAADPVRGIATSGQGGRSLSLGIADSVTVLARSAAAADAAATLIANAVDLPGHPAVKRRPACELTPDSDLGQHLVTVAVGDLSARDIDAALMKGHRKAHAMKNLGLISAASLGLRGRVIVVGDERDSVLSPPVELLSHQKEVVHA